MAVRWQGDLRSQAPALATTCGGSADPKLESDFTTWIVSQLRDARPELVRSLLRESSERRTRRPELASEVAVLLRHPQRELRLLACIVPEHLGSPAACDALSERLRDPDADVQEAAWKALCSITGLRASRATPTALSGSCAPPDDSGIPGSP